MATGNATAGTDTCRPAPTPLGTSRDRLTRVRRSQAGISGRHGLTRTAPRREWNNGVVLSRLRTVVSGAHRLRSERRFGSRAPRCGRGRVAHQHDLAGHPSAGEQLVRAPCLYERKSLRDQRPDLLLPKEIEQGGQILSEPGGPEPLEGLDAVGHHAFPPREQPTAGEIQREDGGSTEALTTTGRLEVNPSPRSEVERPYPTTRPPGRSASRDCQRWAPPMGSNTASTPSPVRRRISVTKSWSRTDGFLSVYDTARQEVRTYDRPRRSQGPVEVVVRTGCGTGPKPCSHPNASSSGTGYCPAPSMMALFRVAPSTSTGIDVPSYGLPTPLR